MSKLIQIREKRIEFLKFIRDVVEKFDMGYDIFYAVVYLLDCILSTIHLEEYTFEELIIGLFHIVLKLEDDFYVGSEIREIVDYIKCVKLHRIQRIECFLCELFDYNFFNIFKNLIVYNSYTIDVDEFPVLLSITDECILFPEIYKWNYDEFIWGIRNVFKKKPSNELEFFIISVIGIIDTKDVEIDESKKNCTCCCFHFHF